MQFTTNTLPKSEFEVRVTVPFAEFQPHVKRAAEVISEEADIEGFRKGKAPYDIVVKKVGEGMVYERAADLAVRKTYPDIFKKLVEAHEDWKTYPPIGRPVVTVTKLAPGNDFEYKVVLALLPKVTLPDWKAIAREVLGEKKDVAPTQKEVEDALVWLRESRLTLLTVDRPAQLGDRMEVDFEIRHGGVKVAEGDSKSHPLILGKGKFIPGFEEALVGLRTGEEKLFTLVAPEDWHEKSFAGKPLDIKATPRLIQERQVPELTDEFAKGLGDFPSVDAFAQNVREGIAKEKQEKETQRIRGMMIDAIAKSAAMEVPEALIEGELDKMVNDFRASVESMGMKWEDYFLHLKKNPEELRNEWREEALRRVRAALALGEMAREVKIEPTKEEVETRASEYLQRFKTAQEATRTIDPKDLHDYTVNILRNEKVFELLESV